MLDREATSHLPLAHTGFCIEKTVGSLLANCIVKCVHCPSEFGPPFRDRNSDPDVKRHGGKHNNSVVPDGQERANRVTTMLKGTFVQ